VRWLLPLLAGMLLTVPVLQSVIEKQKVVTPGAAVAVLAICTLINWLPCKFIRLGICRLGWL
jgi:hypothetical protein